MGYRRMLVLGAVLAASAGSVEKAEAQGLQLRPWVGLYAPTSEIGSVQAVDFGKKESTLAYGLDVDFGGSVLGFRLGAGYAGNSDIPGSGVGCTTAICQTRATVLVATGAVVIRPLPIPVVQPYLVGGAGGKWYNFDFDDEGAGELLRDQAKFAAQLGAGVNVSAGAIGLFAEVSDYISGIDFNNGGNSNTQHDLILKIGLGLGLGR
jgi:hypothetical protein